MKNSIRRKVGWPIEKGVAITISLRGNLRPAKAGDGLIVGIALMRLKKGIVAHKSYGDLWFDPHQADPRLTEISIKYSEDPAGNYISEDFFHKVMKGGLT